MLSGAELVLLAVAALLLAAVCESILAAQKSAAEQKPERPTKEATLSYVVLEEDDNNNSDNRGYVWMPDENASCRHFILVAIAYMVAIAEAIDWLALGDDTGYFSFFRVLVYLLLGIGAELDHSPFHRNGAVQGRARVRALAAFLLSLDRLAPWLGLSWDGSPLAASSYASGASAHRSAAFAAAGVACALGYVGTMLAGPVPLVRAEKPFNPLIYATLVSRLMFFYWRPILKGFVSRDQLMVGDLPNLLPDNTAKACAQHAAAHDRKHFWKARSLFKRLVSLVWVDLLIQAGWATVSLIVVYAAPFGMLGLIDYVSSYDGGPISGSAIFYGSMISLGPLIQAIADAHTFNCGWKMSVRMRALLTHDVCSKALRADASDPAIASTAEITNLLAVDVGYITNFAPMLSWLWMEAAQGLLTLGLLFFILGWGAVGGLAVCFVCFPINLVVMRRIKLLQEKLMIRKDSRMKAVTEAVSSIRSIKFHGWEPQFESRITKLRDEEISILQSFLRLGALTASLWLTTPTLAAATSFLIKSQVLGERLTPAQGFTSLTLFQLLSLSLTVLPSIINSAVMSSVGLRRIETFIEAHEVDGRKDIDTSGLPLGEGCIRNGSFAWGQHTKPDARSTAPAGQHKPSEYTLRNPLLGEEHGSSSQALVDPSAALVLNQINVQVPADSLVVIVGPTGCGKSSLLLALLGDVRCVEGFASLGASSVSYVSQKSWVQNATLRNNILFGAEYDAERYARVVKCCALETDLAALPAGDSTEIGERGVNLSGGQQQRVCLARAVYAKSDIILLDDVLSAVDAHVGAYLFEHCIRGFLRDEERRTVVLVTHAVALTLPYADHAIAMSHGGKIDGQGRPPPMPRSGSRHSLNGSSSDVRDGSAEDGHFDPAVYQLAKRFGSSGDLRGSVAADLAAVEAETERPFESEDGGDVFGVFTEVEEENGVATSETTRTVRKPRKAPRSASSEVTNKKELDKLNVSERRLTFSRAMEGTTASSTPPSNDGARITMIEERVRGAAEARTYLVYLDAAGGRAFCFFFFLALVTYSALNPVQSVCLARWMDAMEAGSDANENDNSNNSEDNDTSNDTPAETQAAAIYGLAALAFVLVTLFRNLLLPVGSVAASETLHGAMCHSVLRAPIAWFEANPLGRVLNRFSSDVAAIDTDVAEQFKDTAVTCLNVVAVTAVCVLGTGEAIASAVVFAAVVVTLVSSYQIWRLYRVAAREQKRLESVTKSPLLAFFAETVAGASIVRAFGQQNRFVTESDARVDDANRALFYLWVSNQWLRATMNAVGSLVAASVVATVLWQAGSLGGSSAGLTLSYATQFTQAVMWLFRIMTTLEVSMNDVERVDAYGRLESEKYVARPPPSNGQNGQRSEDQWESSTSLVPASGVSIADSGGEGAPLARATVPRGDGDDDEQQLPLLPSSWPQNGKLVFDRLRLCYPSNPSVAVLKDLSFTVQGRERVGIVGRTGAGKSSLAVALFRMVEPSSGTIWLDGVDYRTLDLHRLRRSLSIVAQEPTLFRGTLRYNLEPAGNERRSPSSISSSIRAGNSREASTAAGGAGGAGRTGGRRGNGRYEEGCAAPSEDAALWDALRRAGLSAKVTKMGGLDAEVSEGGSNLSAGERQLLCMARALLRQSTILVMDEATASVDPDTDARLQGMVKQEFRGQCTVLTIAHRLATVAFYDQVIVLGGGQVLEHGPPLDLLRKPLAEKPSPTTMATVSATDTTTTPAAASSSHVESSAISSAISNAASNNSSVRASTSAAASEEWIDPCPFRRLAEESGDYTGLVAVAEEELRMRESLRDVNLHD